jgi:hypothetical protein
VVMCVDEPASALAMVEVAAAVIHGQKRRKKLRRRPTLNALQLMEVSDAPSSYFFAVTSLRRVCVCVCACACRVSVVSVVRAGVRAVADRVGLGMRSFGRRSRTRWCSPRSTPPCWD